MDRLATSKCNINEEASGIIEYMYIRTIMQNTMGIYTAGIKETTQWEPKSDLRTNVNTSELIDIYVTSCNKRLHSMCATLVCFLTECN